MDALESKLAKLKSPDAESWKARLFDAGSAEARARVAELVDSGAVHDSCDTLLAQLRDLLETRHPERDLTPAELTAFTEQHLRGVPLSHYGTFVYFPWSRRLVRVLPEAEYRELRTSRNRNKITTEEQALLRQKRIGIVGLSVGQAAALTLAMEEVGGEFVLADFDTLGLSNLNRLRSGVHNLGLNKAVLTAREILELNPYARVELFPEGLREETIDAFLQGPRHLDLVVEECDDFFIKVKVRERARALKIPVLMETSDRGLLDIERFDLEPQRPLFHGLIEGLDTQRFKAMSIMEKLPVAFEIAGGATVSTRMAASAVEVGQTLKTWPQLASAIALAAATSTDAARRIFLGELEASGRYSVDLEHLITDGTAMALKPAPLHGVISAEARADIVAPAVARSTGATPSVEQVRALVGFGAMAPSGGNSQPWRFVFRRGRLECFHEPERSKSFLDYANLASFISFGAVVQNMELVAEQQGLALKVEAFPARAEPNQVCTLTFAPLNRSPQGQELFEQISKRLTNRKPGVRAPMDRAAVEAMVAAAQTHDAQLTVVDDAPRLQAVADFLGPGDRLRFVSRTMNGELIKEIRWSLEEVEKTRDGLDVATLELGPLDLAGLKLATSLRAMELLGKMGGGRALEKPTRRSIGGASAVALLSVPGGHTPAAMFQGGRALQRLWLTATARGYYLQPMTALVCLFWRLLDGAPGLSEGEARELNALRRRYLEVLEVPRGHGEVMLFRLTRADAPTAHSLRRRVDEMLTVAAD